MELEGEPTVQGRRCCLSASRQTIAPAWGAGRMRTVLLTRVGEFRQQQFNALHDQIDVGFPRIDGGVMAMFSESFLVRVADDRKLLGAPRPRAVPQGGRPFVQSSP